VVTWGAYSRKGKGKTRGEKCNQGFGQEKKGSNESWCVGGIKIGKCEKRGVKEALGSKTRSGRDVQKSKTAGKGTRNCWQKWTHKEEGWGGEKRKEDAESNKRKRLGTRKTQSGLVTDR